ncbi:MAG: hypothetical protein J6B75_10170 [Ruminococcus sp.]|nr:hypothetical protein [Ruminococcus sp.]
MNNDLKITIPITKEQRELSEKMTENIKAADIKAVSFEVFGTLVNTPFSEDNDLFLLMEKEFPEVRTAKSTFSDLRIVSEADAKRKNKDKCSVTLSRIYEILAKKAKISDELRDALIKRECDMAVSLVFPRGFGKKLFDTAAESGKKIVLLANSVYPRDIIERMLEICGYKPPYELIAANEVECGENRDESAFNAVIQKGKVPAKQLLHIGGDVAADVETPIMKGAKALLLPDTAASMNRSGRLSGYLRAARIYDYDTAEFLPLHLALGLYGAYIFDIPRNKVMHSDFCGNPYILGFIVYGCCKLADISELDDTCGEILAAVEDCPETRRGGDDLNELFKRHFEAYLGKFSYNGFTLPLEMLANHGNSADVGLLKAHMPEKSHKKWKNGITDAVTAPTGKKSEQNRLEKLADRMFPPGTKVRNMADGVLFKMKGKL